MRVLDDPDARSTVETAADRVAPRRRRRSALMVTAIGVIVAMVEAGRPFDLDGFWHMRDGRFILDHRALPARDPFSWTAGARVWRLDSWLYDVSAALLRRAGGSAAVSLASLVAIVVLAWVCYALTKRRGAEEWPAIWVTAAVTCLIGPWVAERPQIFSYLVFAAVVVLAERALNGSNRAAAGLGLSMIAWSNFHLTFSLGVAVVVLMACGRAVRTRALARPALVAGAAIGGGLVNPYGIVAYTHGLEVRGASRFVQEWRPFDLAKPLDVLVVVLAVSALVAMWRTARLGRLEYSLPIAALLALTLDSTRMAPFLLLLSGPEVAIGLSRLQWRRERLSAPRRRALAHGAILGFAALAVISATRMHVPRASPDTTFPVRAAAAIPAGCRLLNEYNQGGYIIDHRWPAVLVSEDGRNDLYGERELVEQDHVLNGLAGWQQWLDTHQVDCVLAYPYRPLVADLRARGWRQAASDPSAILLLRPGRPN